MSRIELNFAVYFPLVTVVVALVVFIFAWYKGARTHRSEWERARKIIHVQLDADRETLGDVVGQA